MTHDVERRPDGGSRDGAENLGGFTVEGSGPVRPPFPYGRDWPDTDLWCDQDGQVHSGDGPFLKVFSARTSSRDHPLRRLRRALRRWFR